MWRATRRMNWSCLTSLTPTALKCRRLCLRDDFRNRLDNTTAPVSATAACDATATAAFSRLQGTFAIVKTHRERVAWAVCRF
jgi:hypothetical protein